MGLFHSKKKSNKIQSNTIAQPLDRLVNGELPFGWITYHKDYFKPKNDIMVALAMNTQVKNQDDRIQALQILINYFYSYKQECKEKGECFEKYFDDLWMHCKNSICNDFIYIKPYEDELQSLLDKKK